MFLLRSAFWLAVAYVAIHPASIDVGAVARSASSGALAAGQHFIAGQISSNCPMLTCATGGLVDPPAIPVAASALPEARADHGIAPIPRPRLRRVG